MIHFNTDGYVDNLSHATERVFSYMKALEDGDWKKWKTSFREQLRELVGLNRIEAMSGGVPLSPRIVERKQFDTYTREKAYITAEPGIEIPFYVLLPKQGEKPLPLVLTPHGHNRRGKEVYVGNFADDEEEEDALSGERDIARQAVTEGYAVIAMDVRGFNEMAREEEFTSQANNSCADLQKKAQMFGRTLIGERVHDMGRLIDYAATRSEIDASRIVITGNSGGGTVSLFTAALDERISIAVPSCYFCTFVDSIVSIYHCPCNIVPGILQLGEMYDVAGLIAPRPVLFVNGETDPIFPIEATRRSFSHVQAIYREMGFPDRCELYVGNGGHRYYKKPVWPFVKKHLRMSYQM